MNPPLAELIRSLGYQFRDTTLLKTALTHRSAAAANNERLEFLGDSILSFVIAEALFERYPTAHEGDLSRLRASLVNRDSLTEIARTLQLGDHLRLGGGELKSGGFRRPSILADALEAVFAAVYQDSDFSACRALILHLYQSRLADLPPTGELKDPKTRLQERLQAQGQSLPVYTVTEVTGAAHEQYFTIECVLDDERSTVASGPSRRQAEQAAARKALALMT